MRSVPTLKISERLVRRRGAFIIDNDRPLNFVIDHLISPIVLIRTSPKQLRTMQTFPTATHAIIPAPLSSQGAI
jgi:hypothetical protein